MKKSISKGKEMMKVAAISTLSLGLFSLAFVGINQLAFAQAASQTVVEIATATPMYVVETSLPEGFEKPNLRILESPYQHYHPIPLSAMTMEDAAMAGAQYIWDVFGKSVDGMYVTMQFSHWVGRSRGFWQGAVSLDGTGTGLTYSFSIDSITGERVDISMFESLDIEPMTEEYASNILQFREAVLGSGWFDMTLEQRIDFLGLSNETFEGYTVLARAFAEKHFNNSAVVDMMLSDEGLRLKGNSMELSDFVFIAVDDTGREAIVTISFGFLDNGYGNIGISTQHNDFVPGFSYVGGIG